MPEITTVPFRKLTAWTGNVRRTGATDGIDELAASIATHGLLQSLVVQPGRRGKLEVIAGRRRLLALTRLVEAGTIDKDYPVPCIMATDTVDPTELSLAENVVRAPMHPADQFEAFKSLIDKGATTSDVATRFGLSELAVTQRLKLGRLSPVILAAYRNGNIDLECAQAFTVTEDSAEQERVYEQLPEWNREAHTIRRLLTENEIATTDKRVRFVGIEAYQAGGGVIRQDLFCENGSGYITHTALLDRLVEDKLAVAAKEIAAEGWKWVETTPDLSYDAIARFARRYPDAVELSEAEQSELDALAEEYDSLVDTDDADEDRLAAVEARMDELNAKTEAWSEETRRIAGAIVSIGHHGDLRVERGLVRKEDLPKASRHEGADSGDSASSSNDDAKSLSDRLVEDLTAEKSACIGADLMSQHDIALAAVVHALLLGLLYPGCSDQSCLRLSISVPALRSSIAKVDASRGLMALAAEKDRLGDRLPGNPAQLWDWCLAASRDELLALLAYIAGCSVDAVQRKGMRPDARRVLHADALAQALKLDMTAWYAPTAEGFFARIARADILAAIDEAKGTHAPALDKLKKGELAARAEQLLAGTGWLPKPLRIGEASGASDIAAYCEDTD